MNTTNDKYAVFTVCNLAYLNKALVLAESFHQHHNEKLKIYIIDRKLDVDLPNHLAEFYWIEDVGVPDLHKLAFKYDITEFSTSVKPYLTIMLLDTYKKVIFLDPDTCFFHPITPILNDLDNYSIVLTPHYTTPQSDALPDSDIGMMRFGSFNLGFYAIKKTDQALAFLNWWNNRCLRFCYFETQFGLSTDQKWVSIAPCFFQHLHVSFNLGYNVAFWNVHERYISKDQNNTYFVNNKYPLIFFHFSSFDETNPGLLSKRFFHERIKERKDFRDLSVSYNKSLQKYKLNFPLKYCYDYMSNGAYISPTLRRAYACVIAEFPDDHDPFDSDGPVGLFAKRNHLLEKKSLRYIASSYDDIKTHRGKFMITFLLMRVILRLLGPNKFTNFSRLLVYLSSYRQNRELWRF